MRILHCCLAAFYNEGFGYQENILPRMHKKQGHVVKIIASTEKFIDKMNLGYVKEGTFINEDGIEVTRLPYSRILPHKIMTKLRIYSGLYNEISTFSPDVIFLHDAQFVSISSVVKYVKRNSNVKVYVDGHTDFGNSATSYLSKYMLHGIVYRWCINSISPYVLKFYGTLPARVKFFVDFYKTPVEKTELLVLGADDDCIASVKINNLRKVIRDRYHIEQDTILIVTGGKFDERKTSVLNLMSAVRKTSSEFDVKLLIFGSIMSGDFSCKFYELCDNVNVIYAGWINSYDTYAYFDASDIIVFTGSHSVLWEQAVGQGKPCIFNKYMGQTHVDVGGNCLFLNDNSEEEIYQVLIRALNGYQELKFNAETKGMSYFSYDKIAARAIQ